MNPNKKLQIIWTLTALVLIAALALGGCGSAPNTKVYRVGILIGLESVIPIADGFKAGMTDLGYVEGENIIYDVQITNFDIPAYENIIKKFIEDDVDLIVVTPTEATVETKILTQGTDIPVVFTFAFTEGMGIIDSVREPGGNITGVRFPGIDITIKRFEILREIAPQAKRIWIPYQRDYPIISPQLNALAPLANAAGVTLLEFPADSAAEIQAELEARSTAEDVGMDAILFLVEPLTARPDTFMAVAKFAYQNNIPFGGRYSAMDGYSAIFGVNVEFAESGRLAAPLADKVLKGTVAGTIPAVTPENFIQINFTAAQSFGLSVPESLLRQANEIIR